MSVTMQVLMELEREKLKSLSENWTDTLNRLSDRSWDDAWCKKWAIDAWNALFNSGFQLCPVGSYILVKDIPQEEGISAGGIFLPAARTDQELTRAVVVAVPAHGIPLKSKAGRPLGFRPAVVEKGDLVLYEKYRGIEITTKGEAHVLIEESDIVMTLESGQ